jgi:DNA-binding NarL/FixJ family response regulator
MDDDFHALKLNATLLMRDLRTTVCAEAETPDALLGALDQMSEPNVIVVDTEYTPEGMPLESLIKRLREVANRAVIICLSQYGEPSAVRTAVLAGARGFLLKGDIRVAIAPAVVRACRNQFVFTPGVEAALRGEFDDLLREAERLPRWEPNPRLTPRQQEVLWMHVVYKMRASLVAQEMGLSESTPAEYMKAAIGVLKDDLAFINGWADQSDFEGIEVYDLKPEDLAFIVFTALPKERRRGIG